MAPRRKSHLPSRAPSTPLADAAEQHSDVVAPSEDPQPIEENASPDVWTDEQEAILLKSVIRWKPVGMHKHFRMIAITDSLRPYSYTAIPDPHTRSPGIWKKLGTWYNLKALDEREDDDMGYSQDDPMQEPFCDFDLPEEDYWDAIFARRIASERPSSPPAIPYQLQNGHAVYKGRRHSTVDDSEDPRSSPVSITRGPRGGRGGRGRRPSRLAESSKLGRGSRGGRVSLDVSVKDDREAEDGHDDSMDLDDDDVKGKGSTRRSGRRK